jgi:hypothetical protein
MLHWNSWWSRSSQQDANGAKASPNDLMGLHAHFWEQWVDAHRSWWTMYAASLPMMPWPPAGVIAPPEPEQPEAAESHGAESEHKKVSRASRAVRRVHPVASGPAAAKLKQQRKR